MTGKRKIAYRALLQMAADLPYCQHPVWRCAWRFCRYPHMHIEALPGTYVEMDANDDEYRPAE